jgi:hypothetical protein
MYSHSVHDTIFALTLLQHNASLSCLDLALSRLQAPSSASTFMKPDVAISTTAVPSFLQNLNLAQPLPMIHQIIVVSIAAALESPVSLASFRQRELHCLDLVRAQAEKTLELAIKNAVAGCVRRLQSFFDWRHLSWIARVTHLQGLLHCSPELYDHFVAVMPVRHVFSTTVLDLFRPTVPSTESGLIHIWSISTYPFEQMVVQYMTVFISMVSGELAAPNENSNLVVELVARAKL